MRFGVLVVGLVLVFGVAFTAAQITQIYSTGEWNILIGKDCNILFQEINGQYKGFIVKGEENVPFISKTLPDCSYGACSFKAEWNKGVVLNLLGSVKEVCVGGKCTEIAGKPSTFFVGKKPFYDVSVVCRNGETVERKVKFFPVKFFPLENGKVKIEMEGKCRVYKVCVDGICGKKLINLAVSENGGFFHAALVCDGKVIEKNVFIPGFEGKKKPKPTKIPHKRKRKPHPIFSPVRRLQIGGKTLGIIRPLVKTSILRVESDANVFQFVPEINTPPAQTFFYIHKEGRVAHIQIEHNGPFFVWKLTSQGWKSLGHYNDRFELNIQDNGPYDLNKEVNVIDDPIAVGDNNLTLSAYVDKYYVHPGDTVLVYGTLEKNGNPVVDNWINIYLDGNQVGNTSYKSGKANWPMPDWWYRRPITITNNATRERNLIVRITLNSSNFDFSKAKSDGSDVRFTDENGNPIPFWIEEWNTSIPEAKIWVRLDNVPAGASETVYMYYGNPNATSESNAVAVFGRDIAGVVGEDGYYVGFRLVNREWVEANNDTGIHSDDTGASVTLPFSVLVYDTNRDAFYLNPNGYLMWDNSAVDDWSSTTSEFQSRKMLAIYWVDLRTDSEPSNGIYEATGSDTLGDYVVFKWDATAYGASQSSIFEAVVYKEGFIIFNYEAIVPGASTTDNTPVEGISYGDSTNYIDTTGNAESNRDSILFVPKNWDVSYSVGSEEDTLADKAVYVSNALDTGFSSVEWTQISWDSYVPAGTNLKVYVRTSPDGTTWSPWYEVTNGGDIPAPGSRYIEYNLVFTSTFATGIPYFDNLKITYYSSSGGFTLVPSSGTDIYTSDPNPYECGSLSTGEVCYPHWRIVPTTRGAFTLRMDVTSDCNTAGSSNEKVFYTFEKTLIDNFTSDKNVVARGDSLTVSGKLLDIEGNPVVGEKIYIFDDNTLLGTTITGSDGSFSFTYQVPANATLGDHTITAYFPTDGIAFYWKSSAKTTVRYSSTPRIENLTVSPSTCGIGDTVTISANVYDDVGIKSVTATITSPSGTSSTVDMNCSGNTCTAETNSTWDAGTYSVVVTATNLDGIQSTASTSFSVEAHANIGFQLEKNVYGANETVKPKYYSDWAVYLSTLREKLELNKYGYDVSVLVPYGSYLKTTDVVAAQYLPLSGVVVGGSFVTGKIGEAYNPAGSGYIEVPALRPLRPTKKISIAAWITPGSGYIVSLPRNGASEAYALYANGSSVCFRITTSATYEVCGSLSSGWNHVVAVYDGAYARIYVNGVEANEAAVTGNIDYSGASNVFLIGATADVSGITSSYDANIDEVKVFDWALTAEDVEKLYNGGTVQPVAAYYPLDGNGDDAAPGKILPVLNTEGNLTFYWPLGGTIDTVNGAELNNGAAYGCFTVSGDDLNEARTFSFITKVYPTSYPVYIAQKGTSTPSWSLEINGDGYAVCTVTNSAGTFSVSSSGTLDLNIWHVVGCSVIGSQLLLYVDGTTFTKDMGNVLYEDYENNADLNICPQSSYVDDVSYYGIGLPASAFTLFKNGYDVPGGRLLYLTFDDENHLDESNDFYITLYFSINPFFSSDAPTSGYEVNGGFYEERSAICNVGDTNIRGYLYADVQTGSGSTWSTIPPTIIDDRASGTVRLIPPDSCLDLTNLLSWNTDSQSPGLYRMRYALLKPGGTASDVSTYVTTSDGTPLGKNREFNIVGAVLQLSNLTHENLAEHNLIEYETSDTINWIDVTVKATQSDALDANVTLSLVDEYGSYAGFGPNNETKDYGTIPKDTEKTEEWNNGGLGYYIPTDITPGVYKFYWKVVMQASNASLTEDGTKYIIVHNLPSEFNVDYTERIYIPQNGDGNGYYKFFIHNQWSKEINDLNVSINCPSELNCFCSSEPSSNTCHIGSLGPDSNVWVEFNIIAPNGIESNDYDVDVNVEYINPGGEVKHWDHVMKKTIEVRYAGIVAINMYSYPTDVVRGEEYNFNAYATNTGDVNDENAWIAYTVYPSSWTIVNHWTNGATWTDGNAMKYLLQPYKTTGEKLDNNVTFSIPLDANLGPQLVKLTSGTATNANWSDFKNLTVTVWARTSTKLEANDYNMSVGETIELNAQLLLDNNTPLANQTVYFDANGSPIASAKTDSQGYAVITWSPTNVGEYNIVARYEGNNDLYTLGSSDWIIVNVGYPPDVNGSVSPSLVGYGIPVTLEANAADDQGIQRVWAEINRPDGVSEEVNLTLQSGDTYTGSYTPWKEGNYTVYFYAEDEYGSVSKDGPYTFSARASAQIGVVTDKNYYLQGDLVDINASGWWDAHWKYRRKLVINGPTATKVQVPFYMDTLTLGKEGKLRPDAGDLRIIDENGNELNYWFRVVPSDENIVPQGDADSDPTTSNTNCAYHPAFKYYYCLDYCEPIGWYKEDFDDSSWTLGNTPFGDSGTYAGACTNVLNNTPDDLFVRKWIYIPGKPKAGTLRISVGGGVRCYLNEVLVIDELNVNTDPTYWNYTVDVSSALREGNNLLACWVASGGENNRTTGGYFDVDLEVNYDRYLDTNQEIWVLTNVPATLYVYYGNPNATHTLDPESVFLFYDDFDGNELNTAKWTVVGSPSYQVSNGYIAMWNNYDTSNYIRTNKVFTMPIRVDMKIRRSANGSDTDIGVGFGSAPWSGDLIAFDDNSQDNVIIMINSNWGTYGTGLGDTNWHYAWAGFTNGTFYAWGDWTGEQPYTSTGTPASDTNWLSIFADTDSTSNYGYIDWIRVRKFVYPEPTASLGEEETVGGSYIFATEREFKGYLVGVIERNENGGWTRVATDFNNVGSNLTTFLPYELIELNQFWQEWNTYGQPEGLYRACIYPAGADGEPLTYEGKLIEACSEFNIGPPPVDVNISDFRIYDVNDVNNPRTEGNLLSSGLEKTHNVAVGKLYRLEFDVTVKSNSNDLNVADLNALLKDLNSEWNVTDIWYTLPDGNDENGGSFNSGVVEWNTENDGSVSAGYTVTFKLLLNLREVNSGGEYNLVFDLKHPAFIERNDWVDLKLYVPDTTPPEANEYNMENLDTNQVGPEINVIRTFQKAKIYAVWNEDISDAYVEYNSTSSTLVTDSITPDGNYTEYNFAPTSQWLLGPHVAKIHAADLSGNWNNDLNFLTFYIWGIADVSSIDLNDTNVYEGDTVEINCTVVDRTDSNNPIQNYPVSFYVDGTFIGKDMTDSNGIASLNYTFSKAGYHTVECNVETNKELWYMVIPPSNEKNTTIFVKETVPPEWNEVEYNTKVHRDESLETNVHWTDNYQVDTVKLLIGDGTDFNEVNTSTYDSNDVWAYLTWTVPSNEPLGVHYWYQEANDPSGNVTDTNKFEFNVWGWASVSDSSVNPPGVNPEENVTMYCRVIDRDLGNGINNYEVNFYWDGNYIGSSETNSDGWASFEYNVGNDLGLHNFTCKIGSDANKLYDPYPSEDSRTEQVNVTTSSDTNPPDAVEWNVIDVNTNVEGKEINVYRGDELNFWSVWDENLSSAWVEYSIDGTTETNTSATVDGNKAIAILDTNTDWSRGLHTLTMKAMDEANNVSIDANSADVNVYVWVYSDVKWISPTGTVNQSSDMNAVCKVYEDDSNAGIPNYTVAFYSSKDGGTFLGTAETNSDGYATLFVDLNDYYGTYTFWCQISDDPSRYYKTKTDTDSTTIRVAAINLKAESLEVNTSSPADEGVPVLIEGNILNEYDAVDANVEIRIERREGNEWVLWESYKVLHSFDSNEENTFSYVWTTYPGTYRISIIADPDGKVSEENENDNNISLEFNVYSWTVVYGDVNAQQVLGANTSVYYIWKGGSDADVIAYDSDYSIDPTQINGMNIDDIRLADKVLGMDGSWDSLERTFDSDGDGNVDNTHTFLIEGRAVTMPVIYEDNRPVGIGYIGSSFDGNQPIVFVTEVNWGGSCSYGDGTCDYVMKIPALLRRQDPTTETVALQVVKAS